MRWASHLAAAVIFGALLAGASAQRAGAASQCLVVYKVYGPGGASGAEYNRSFVDLLNRCTTPVSLAGVYLKLLNSANSNANQIALTGSLGAGRYYLVGVGFGGGSGASLPTPDANFPPGVMSLPIPGKVFLSTDPASSFSCPSGAALIDLVGYGSSSVPCFEGSGPAVEPNGAFDVHRQGCSDSDDNAADFALSTSSASTSALNSAVASPLCGGTPSPCLVINEVYASGGSPGATYNQSFAEVLNRCTAVISLPDVRLVIRDSSGSFGFSAVHLRETTLGPGRFYLYAIGAPGASGGLLPIPDRDLSSFTMQSPGKVYLSMNHLLNGTGSCPIGIAPGLVDLVGYGTSTQPCFEGAGPAPLPDSTHSVKRTGCVDSDNNSADFTLSTPPTPQSSGSAPVAVPCPGTTAAVLATFAARRSPGRVTVRWRTGSELGLLGFNLYRDAGNRRLLLNRALIAARGSASALSYTFADRRAPRSGRVAYRLEAVGLGGDRTWYGPVRPR